MKPIFLTIINPFLYVFVLLELQKLEKKFPQFSNLVSADDEEQLIQLELPASIVESTAIALSSLLIDKAEIQHG